uniref:LGFP repeat-containing protein n=1 Tax=Planococcus sp. 4-30 TaxID=2874583 RepID=UPI001CBF82DE
FRSLHEPGKPEKSIYWTPKTGAQEVYGGIREHWKNLGWERSSLGYPIGAERDQPGGGRMQEFENGIIDWTPEKGSFLRNEKIKGIQDIGKGTMNWTPK